MIQVEGRKETAPKSDRPWLEPTTDFSISHLERVSPSEPSFKRVLSAGEKDVSFESEPFCLRTWEGEPPHFESVRFSEAIEELRDLGFANLFLRVLILYSDMVDESNEYEIFRITSAIESVNDLEDFLSQGSFSIKGKETHKFPDNLPDVFHP